MTGRATHSHAAMRSGSPSITIQTRARRGDIPGEGLARNGAAKKLHPVSLHNSATPHQIAGVDAGGQGHAVAVVDGGVKLTSSSAAAPLANAYGGMVPKVREAAPIKPGMKSQQGG